MTRVANSSKLDESRFTSQKETQNYWGFANFPNQVFRRAVKNGFDFTLMVVGRSGLGKSTFINTLFLAEINNLNEEKDVVAHPHPSTVRVEEKLVKLVENSVSLNLTLVDTPGFGDAVNNSKCWEPIVNYVESKFFEHFCEETRIDREEKIVDKCVHLCLYFIEPSGHGLKPIDIELMKHLHGRVNIVPVIAKADCLTRDELRRFKKQIVRDAEAAEIKLYKFPEVEEDSADKAAAEMLKKTLPFAIIGSNSLREKDGKRIRYREYPWGTVEVENMDHNDFLTLRDMIIRTNLIDMVDVTRNVHYENFRFRQMEGLPKNEKNRDPFTHLEEERRQKDRELTEKRATLERVFTEKTASRKQRNDERMTALEEAETLNKQKLDAKRAEIIRLRHEINELRNGNMTSSQTSLAMYNENNHSQNSTSSTMKSSPPTTVSSGTMKKRIGTLGLFNRNN
uniref:Septin n=1 Tax=Caenorhabditis japonica TaxID=281687 RepID=A0A8R1DRZ0_CAEJA